MKPELCYVGPGCWEPPRQGDMKTVARIYATEEMLDSVYEDRPHAVGQRGVTARDRRSGDGDA